MLRPAVGVSFEVEAHFGRVLGTVVVGAFVLGTFVVGTVVLGSGVGTSVLVPLVCV